MYSPLRTGARLLAIIPSLVAELETFGPSLGEYRSLGDFCNTTVVARSIGGYSGV